MEITFVPAKDEINGRKHRVSLSLASKIDWPEVWFEVDARSEPQGG